MIGIGLYYKPKNENEIEVNGKLEDLDDGIGHDITHIVTLFKQELGYDVFPADNDLEKAETFTWNKTDLMRFLRDRSMELDASTYDGLLLVLSCHGVENHIITSDYRKIKKTDIHRVFSESGKSRDIPRVFVFDSCEGSKDHDRLRGIGKAGRSAVDDDWKCDEDVQPPNVQWGRDQKGPDYKLAVLNAANAEFQSKTNGRKGSYFITNWAAKLRANIFERNNARFFSEICAEVQAYLHDDEQIQHSTHTFNDGTEYIKFVRNGASPALSRPIDDQDGGPDTNGVQLSRN
mmetsp:Transcript_38504/g.61529  ORF Transcript_38504/g.61529 Transcript_38504/m.61529 type:complete len:290 (+) Transcript_38504:2-871(+)